MRACISSGDIILPTTPSVNREATMYIQEGVWLCPLETYQLGNKASDEIRGEKFNSNCVYTPSKMS